MNTDAFTIPETNPAAAANLEEILHLEALATAAAEEAAELKAAAKVAKVRAEEAADRLRQRIRAIREPELPFEEDV